MRNIRFISLLLLPLLLLVFSGSVDASEISAFGPKQYIRTKGAPNIYTDSFTAFPGEAWLVIRNGSEDQDKKTMVTSGVISLNGTVLFTHDDFKHKTYILETPITLLEENTLRVELESKPSTYLSLEIIQNIPDPVTNLMVSELQVDNRYCPEYVDISLRLGNSGETDIPAGVQVAFYSGNPDEDGVLIGTKASTGVLTTGEYEDISFRWSNAFGDETVIYARADDDGTGAGSLDEEDETDNLISKYPTKIILTKVT